MFLLKMDLKMQKMRHEISKLSNLSLIHQIDFKKLPVEQKFFKKS